MATSADLLLDAFGRVREVVHEVCAGLTPEQLGARVDPDATSIGWLVWHLTRVQDDHVAHLAGLPQVWTGQGWVDRFVLPYDVKAHGYGMSSVEVGKFAVDGPDLLTSYHDCVHEQTVGYVRGLSSADLDRVVDTRWDPPVTVGVRLVSVLADDLQHAGQAAFVRGLLGR